MESAYSNERTFLPLQNIIPMSHQTALTGAGMVNLQYTVGKQYDVFIGVKNCCSTKHILQGPWLISDAVTITNVIQYTMMLKDNKM